MSTSIDDSHNSSDRQITKEAPAIPKKAVAILLAVLVFGVFMVGFDQGEVFGMSVPADGSGGTPGTNWSHEFYHDMRHAAGFPCH
jgi:hypothetical protein